MITFLLSLLHLVMCLVWYSAATDYFLQFWLTVMLQRTVEVPGLLAFFISLFASPLTVPGAIITWLLRVFQVI